MISLAAAATAVIDLGLNGSATHPAGVTINQFATNQNTSQIATNQVINDVAGNDTGIRFSTSGGLYSAGPAGTFSPAGSTTYTGGNAIIDGWIANEQLAFGDIWQGVSNASGADQTVSFTFSGLAANTEYTFKLLSARANNFGSTDLGTYQMSYGADPLTGGGSKAMAGSAGGLNAGEYTWTFTTGATPTTAAINLSGAWNANAIIIVPEPASAALLGLSGLAFAFGRRRRA